MKFVACIIILLTSSTLATAAYGEGADATQAATPDQEQPTDVAAATKPVEALPVAEATDPLLPLLLAENAGRAKTNRIGGLVLGGWALANFGWATVGLLGQPEERPRAFHLTNAVINLVVAGVSVSTYFANLPNEDWASYDAVRTLNETHSTEKLYLLSTGLDFAYIATGAFLTAKGNLDRKEGMVGTGRSLMLQGSFLAAFDIAMFTFHWLRRSTFVSRLTEPGGAPE